MQCEKVQIDSKKLALIILEPLKKRKDRKEKGVYKCRKCGFWHLSSQEVIDERH